MMASFRFVAEREGIRTPDTDSRVPHSGALSLSATSPETETNNELIYDSLQPAVQSRTRFVPATFAIPFVQ